jgi:hypothetical protein
LKKLIDFTINSFVTDYSSFHRTTEDLTAVEGTSELEVDPHSTPTLEQPSAVEAYKCGDEDFTAAERISELELDPYSPPILEQPLTVAKHKEKAFSCCCRTVSKAAAVAVVATVVAGVAFQAYGATLFGGYASAKL